MLVMFISRLQSVSPPDTSKNKKMGTIPLVMGLVRTPIVVSKTSRPDMPNINLNKNAYEAVILNNKKNMLELS